MERPIVGKQRARHAWVQASQRVKFDAGGKAEILRQAQEIVNASAKLRQKVSRMDMRGNRVYLYELFEPSKSEGAIFTKPIINGKYLEYLYARVTVNNDAATSCTLDWQRHNGQWMELKSGTLQECLTQIENDDTWF